uniref:Uncharacterized protein n=1 Tax=Anguilla anguilla TaxID=7936 RepID=A0A0E9X1E5_ANGAN
MCQHFVIIFLLFFFFLTIYQVEHNLCHFVTLEFLMCNVLEVMIVASPCFTLVMHCADCLY